MRIFAKYIFLDYTMQTAYSPVNHIFVRFSQVLPGGVLRLYFPHFPSHETLSTAFQICQEPTLEFGLAILL